MQRKVIWMISSSLVVFSLQGFSQTTTTIPSSHPKMDKYYPQAQKTQTIYDNPDTIKVMAPAKPVTTTNNAPVMTTAPVTTDNVVQPKSNVTPTIPQQAPEPVMPTTSAITNTSVSVDTAATRTVSSNTISKPATVKINKPPVQVAPAAPTSNYVDPSSLFTTRLGSSSPQYDTWKKNDDGAGSVTTQSKQ